MQSSFASVKKPNVKQINDFRPVALTSNLAKCMERIRCNQLVASVADRMDTNLFAYKARRDVEDACLVLVNLIVQELCESRGGRPGLSVLTSLLVSVDVKNY